MSGKNLAIEKRAWVARGCDWIGRRRVAPWAGLCAALLAAVALTACGSGSSGGGGGTTVTPPPTPVANTIDINVNSGPNNVSINTAYVSVTVCNPGTSTCATVPDVKLDTGSTGLRLLASAPGVSTLTLKAVTNSGGTPVDECIEFNDGTYIWGPVMQADVEMAGEKASGLPVQIIDSGSSPANVPSACSNGGVNRGTSSATVDGLNANGILGVGPDPQDCGEDCVTPPVAPYYYLCPNGEACSSNAALGLAIQVSNPAIFLNSDNNGVTIALQSVGASGASSVTGTLNFGVGTQSDNALGTANVYPLGLWPSGAYAGDYVVEATYSNVNYPAFLDTGSPEILFLDPTTIGVAACTTTDTIFYCPPAGSNPSFTITNTGYNGTSATASITIANAQSLLSNTGLAAFSDLVGVSGGTGASNDAVEYGLPFFYGRTIFVGVAGATAPTGVSAAAAGTGYWAF